MSNTRIACVWGGEGGGGVADVFRVQSMLGKTKLFHNLLENIAKKSRLTKLQVSA